MVLEACDKFHGFDGSIIPIDEAKKTEVTNAIECNIYFILCYRYGKQSFKNNLCCL
jgi:hypothetical protein